MAAWAWKAFHPWRTVSQGTGQTEMVTSEYSDSPKGGIRKGSHLASALVIATCGRCWICRRWPRGDGSVGYECQTASGASPGGAYVCQDRERCGPSFGCR